MSERYHDGIITKVERQKRGKDRYNIFIDEQFAFPVHEDILIKFKLMKGSLISKVEMGKIIQAQEKQQAYLDAIRLLSSRLHSEYELGARLKQKGYDALIIADTLEKLRGEQYLNDALFAEQLTNQRIGSQKKGRHWVKQELKFKGLQPEQISHALNQVDGEVEYNSALELAVRKYNTDAHSDPLKAKRKTVAFLQRRGFSSDIISRVMKQMGTRVDDEGDMEEEMDY
jgi:regulatory protein